MKVYEDLEEMLNQELKEITKKGDINAAGLETIYKIIDVLKDINEIRCSKEDEGYSRMHGWRVTPTYGYGDGGSYRNYQDSGSYMHGNSYARRYSRNSPEEKLAMMMDEATTAQEREIIQRCMDKLGY